MLRPSILSCLLLLGFMMPVSVPNLQAQGHYCCHQINWTQYHCQASGCDQYIYVHSCDGGWGANGASWGYQSCCTQPILDVQPSGLCMAPQGVRTASLSPSRIAEPIYILDCSGRYVFVTTPVSGV
jgi:hypothetical protein